MKTRIFGIILTAFVAGAMSASCAKDSAVGSDCSSEKKVAYISLDAEGSASGVKSSLGADCKVSWEAGDDILYYTGCHATGATSTEKTYDGSYKVPASGAAVSLPVEYLDGDNRVTILTKGRSVGAVPSPATLNSITVEDAVPASQTGTFASCYLAAAEGNLLELANGTGNLSLTPLQSYIRFKLSNLTVGDKTVNRIEIEGSSAAGGDKVCGDLVVSITEDGSHTVTVAPSSEPDALGTKITIDKTASKFNAGEYIYAALLPQQYDELTLTLYNGSTTLATVPVKQGSGSQIDLGQGKMVDLGEINPHAVIKFISAKMYPEKVAISSAAERPTKYLWLKIEPEDFSGTVTWESSNTSYATVESVGTPVDEPGIGKCIRVQVTNKVNHPSDNYNFVTGTGAQPVEYNVNITATITDQSDGQTYTRTCEITIGNFLDLGIRNSEGKRILFMRHILRSNRQETPPITYQPYYGEERNTPYDPGDGQDDVYGQMRVLFGWGEIHSTRADHMEPLRFAWTHSNGKYEGESSSENGEYSKYNLSRHLPHLQRYSGEFVSEGIPLGDKYDTVDDVASRWNQDCNIPTVSDMVAFIRGTKKDPTKYTYTGSYGYGTSYYKVEGTSPGYTDTYLYITDRAQAAGAHPWDGNFGWWTCEYEEEYVGNAFWFDGTSYSIKSTNKYRRTYVRPVKYVD